MSLIAMPVLIINLGGEMVYILEQRLQAQSISPEKSARVLQDVIRTMFNPSFITALFKTQEIYSYESIRGIFDRLAHSSIMRLSENSMNKLYDLMTMGFKYQLLTCTYPGELLRITYNHLDAMKAAVNAPSICELVDNVVNLTTQTYQNLSYGQFDLLRQTLLTLFQDKRVKVSLFLQESMQNPDGSIVIPMGGITPPGTEVPGKIKYFDPAGEATYATENTGTVFVGKDCDRPCNSGLNLYKGKKSKKKDKKRKSKASAKASSSAPSPKNPQPDGKAAKAEMSLLAGLIGQGAPVEDEFKINLFPEIQSKDGSAAPNVLVLETEDLDADGVLAQNPELAGVFADMTVEDADDGEEDDLLALMDQA